MKSKPEKGNASVVGATEASNVNNQEINQGLNMFDSTVVTTNTATATPDLVIVDGQITTTSLQIAEHFGKLHKTVLRAVTNLDCSPEFTERNFAPSEYTDATGRKLPCYRITRDGFVFLAMGFTGKEAAQWKEAYITAFNQMEAQLRGKQAEVNPAIDYTRISPAQKQDLQEIVAAIVEAGIQGYGETWARFHKKFRINKYEELPFTRYEEARKYLIGKLPSGYDGAIYEESVPVERLGAALAAANAVAIQVQHAAVMAMMKSEDLRRGRWMVSFGYGAEAVPSVKQIEHHVCVAPIDKFHLLIEDNICVDPQTLTQLASTCMAKLSRMAQSNSKVLTT